jgi:hypothetical protein
LSKKEAQEFATILQADMHEAFGSIYPAVPIESELEILETWK